MKSVVLSADTWASIERRLTVEVGADDKSRTWAAMIHEQVSGSIKVRATHGGMNVTLKAPKGGDLRGVIEALAGVKAD